MSCREISILDLIEHKSPRAHFKSIRAHELFSIRRFKFATARYINLARSGFIPDRGQISSLGYIS